MYKLTEVYVQVVSDSHSDRKTLAHRDVLVNPANVAYIRDFDEVRRVYFCGGDDDYLEVEESMEHLVAYLVPVEAVRR